MCFTVTCVWNPSRHRKWKSIHLETIRGRYLYWQVSNTEVDWLSRTEKKIVFSVYKASTLHSVFDDTFNKTFSPSFVYMLYVRPVCKGQMIWVVRCLIVSLLQSEKQQSNSNNTNTYTQCLSYTTVHENDNSCFLSSLFHRILSLFLSFFLSLLCRHTHRTHTHTFSQKHAEPLHNRGLHRNWYRCPVIICTPARIQVSYRCPFTAQDIPGTQIRHKCTHTRTLQEQSVFYM